MNYSEILAYYSREDVQAVLLSLGKNREVAGVFNTGSFGTRPNTLIYPNDIIAMVKKGVVEFHCSLEHWSRPMAIKTEDYQSYERLRTGWDLILDIDCKDTEHGKIATRVLLWALGKHNIKNVSIKFTGGTGFHVGIPWESIPNSIDYRSSVSQFPDLARHMGLYLKDFMRTELEKKLLKKYMPTQLAETVGKPLGKILKGENFDPYQIVDIDPVLISPRHLFRMPYSLHRKTGLVSKPLSEEQLEDFKKEDARPESTRALTGFLSKGKQNETEFLIAESVDWWARVQREEIRKMIRKPVLQRAVPLELAPPCIKLMLEGLPDGRKRSLFILVNYLSSLKWKWDNIQSAVTKWNEKNSPPMRLNYLRTHLRWHRARKQSKLPPNCSNEGWMIDIGVCKPDATCGGQKRTVKNPVSYPLKKMSRMKPKRRKRRTVYRRRPEPPRAQAPKAKSA